MTVLSVIVPTFNRSRDLRRCLEALERQTADPGSFEVVVVDDGSGDDTPEALAEFSGRLPLRALRHANRGPSAARNLGIREAAGELCLFIDDDILAAPELVAEHIRGQREGPAIGLGRLDLEMLRAGGLAAHFARWWNGHYDLFSEGREPDFWDCFTGNMSVPAAALAEVGGFDEELRRSEDVELGLRLFKAGLRPRFLPRARARQRNEKGFRALARDFDRAGGVAPALWRRHPELLGHAPLGSFAQGSPAAVILRRALLATRAPIWPLAIVDPLLRRRPPAVLYRFLQRYCYWRSLRKALGDREAWRRLTRGPVFLMYHAIGSGERPSRYVLPQPRFRRQLAWLRLRGRPVISLDEYVTCRAEHRLPPARAVVITFDDGYADTAELAAPLLEARGLGATVFLVSGRMGGTNDWGTVSATTGRPLMSWDQARELAGRGFELGAHTESHPHLPELDGQDAVREIAASRAGVEEAVGVPVRHFAYPYGERSPEIEAAVLELGFASAVAVEPGVNDPVVSIERLHRLEVRGTRRLPGFIWDMWREGRGA
jgi:glycosyltransferase involved in cell wall biosynthesis/peptidoglycan/xylan/chitin deacetylase (PgdA/CDA1 family)